MNGIEYPLSICPQSRRAQMPGLRCPAQPQCTRYFLYKPPLIAHALSCAYAKSITIKASTLRKGVAGTDMASVIVYVEAARQRRGCISIVRHEMRDKNVYKIGFPQVGCSR